MLMNAKIADNIPVSIHINDSRRRVCYQPRFMQIIFICNIFCGTVILCDCGFIVQKIRADRIYCHRVL